MSKSAKKPRLGRGLNSLLGTPVAVQPPKDEAGVGGPEGNAATAPQGNTPPEAAVSRETTSDPIASAVTEGPDNASDNTDHLRWVPVQAVVPNPYQPRRTFDEATLQQLADSIRQDGVMQPVVIRPIPPEELSGEDGPVWQLVAGERRWRAAQLAEVPQIPAVVRTLTDQQLAEWAVIENLQREDLNPIDRAEAFARLARDFQLTHQDIAKRLGADRSTVANTLRLLDLHEDVRDLVRQGRLSAGHGRALLALPTAEHQLELAKRAVAGGWSVRMVETAVRRSLEDEPTAPARKHDRVAHLAELEQQIAHQLATKVHIKPARKKGAGTLHIDFYDLDQFDALLSRLGVTIET